jgi:hypothetical protein
MSTKIAVPDIRKVRYAKPTRSDMAVVMVMFNACDSVRIVQNWLYVWNKLVTAEIPVFGVELLYPWQKPALADAFKTLTVRSDSIMFHKEKLVERLLRDVPATFTKVCYMDCDVIFHRADWYDAVSAALDENSVVQPFSRCFWLAPDLRNPLASHPSATADLDKIRAAHASGASNKLSGYPGFAMAMRRGVSHFPYAIVGGGDAIFFRGVTGLAGDLGNERMRGLLKGSWDEWLASVGTQTIGMVDVFISHMWHGSIAGRQYYDRYKHFMEAVPGSVTDIRDLVVENSDGVWSWRPEYRNTMNKMMLHYFAGRNDDAVDLN